MTIDIGGADAEVRFEAEHSQPEPETGWPGGWTVTIRAVLVAGERVARSEWQADRLEADVAELLAAGAAVGYAG